MKKQNPKPTVGGARPGAGRKSKRVNPKQLNIAIEGDVHDYIRAQAAKKKESPADWIEALVKKQMPAD